MAITTNEGQDLVPENGGELSHDQVQKAKDFLWEYIDFNNKKLLVEHAEGLPLEKHGLETTKISIYYSYK